MATSGNPTSAQTAARLARKEALRRGSAAATKPAKMYPDVAPWSPPVSPAPAPARDAWQRAHPSDKVAAEFSAAAARRYRPGGLG
jgi:hypothetical protein